MALTKFNAMEIDAIGEIMNISFGASATAVSNLLGTPTNITTPVVTVQNRDEFESKELEPAIGVEISYTQGLSGKNVMMFSREDVRIIVGMMMGMEIPEEEFVLDEMNKSAICEVMNQMMGSSATALSEFLGYSVNISTPKSFEITNVEDFKEQYFTEDDEVVVRFRLEIADRLQSKFLILMSVDLVKHLLEPFRESMGLFDETAEESQNAFTDESFDESFDESQGEADKTLTDETPVAVEEPMSDEEARARAAQMTGMGRGLSQEETDAIMRQLKQETQNETQTSMPQAAQSVVMAQPAMDPVMLQLLSQMQASQTQMMELIRDMKEETRESREKAAARQASKEQQRSSAVVRPMNAESLEDNTEEGEELQENRDMLMKVPLEISVEIGRTMKPVKDILELTQGSLVVLDKMAGEQADLYVNGECVARGDVVVVEDNFGIRVTEILNRDLYLDKR